MAALPDRQGGAAVYVGVYGPCTALRGPVALRRAMCQRLAGGGVLIVPVARLLGVVRVLCVATARSAGAHHAPGLIYY
jgi:hypothetical protein